MSLDLSARRSVDVNGTLDWLGQPGEYVVRGCGRTDVARLRRLAAKNGLRLRSTWDSGVLTVDLDPKP